MTRRHRLIVWARHRPHLVAYLLVVGFAAGSIWRVEATASDAQQTADAVHELVLDNEAQQCVDDWELNDAMLRMGPASNVALIEAFPNADPAKVAAVKEATTRVVDELVDDPDCDLDAAHRRLAD
jgi:molybdopterin-guanine dinucleotide biosynthesis protein